MLWSFVYLAVRRVFALIVLMFRGGDAKEVEIPVLRHEPEVLRRQHPRPRLERPTGPGWRRSAGLCRGTVAGVHGPSGDLVGLAPQARLSALTFARKGRPPLPAQLQRLIVRLCSENPTWG